MLALYNLVNFCQCFDWSFFLRLFSSWYWIDWRQLDSEAEHNYCSRLSTTVPEWTILQVVQLEWPIPTLFPEIKFNKWCFIIQGCSFFIGWSKGLQQDWNYLAWNISSLWFWSGSTIWAFCNLPHYDHDHSHNIIINNNNRIIHQNNYSCTKGFGWFRAQNRQVRNSPWASIVECLQL